MEFTRNAISAAQNQTVCLGPHGSLEMRFLKFIPNLPDKKMILERLAIMAKPAHYHLYRLSVIFENGLVQMILEHKTTPGSKSSLELNKEKICQLTVLGLTVADALTELEQQYERCQQSKLSSTYHSSDHKKN